MTTITKPMLAGKAPDILKFPLLASPKLDGIRCLIVGGKALTRSFKDVPNNFIRTLLSSSAFEGLDGELMLYDRKAPFQEVTSAVMNVKFEPRFVYHVFDLAGANLRKPFSERLRDLEAMKLPIFVQPVQHEVIYNQAQLDEYEATMLAAGYEGVMLRDPNGPYKCGRSTANEGYLLKLKRFVDAEAVVLALEERQTNLNPAFKDELGRTKRSSAKAGQVGYGDLGALVVRDVKTKVEFKIGTGFDDAQRSELWKAGSTLIGKLVKYKSQPTGVKSAPRFPVFLGFRDARDL